MQHLPTSSDRFGDIKHTYDVIEELLQQLESQGEVVNQQRMLVHQLLSKFPLEVIVKLEDTKKCDQVWTIDLLRRLLNQYIAVRENAQRRVNNARGNIFQRNNFLQGRQTNRSPMNPDATGNQPSVETFAANVERKRIAPLSKQFKSLSIINKSVFGGKLFGKWQDIFKPVCYYHNHYSAKCVLFLLMF